MSIAPRYYSSSEMLAIVGTTRKTLRVIEARGLMRPALRSGTRRYSHECLRRLWLVIVLRNLGFSLDDVARLLDDGETAPEAGEAARALAVTVTRVIRRIDGTIRDLELAREALVTARGTLEGCTTCREERAACDGCARAGKLDVVTTVLLTRAGRRVEPVATPDPAAETSVRRRGPEGPATVVRALHRSRE